MHTTHSEIKKYVGEANIQMLILLLQFIYFLDKNLHRRVYYQVGTNISIEDIFQDFVGKVPMFRLFQQFVVSTCRYILNVVSQRKLIGVMGSRYIC